MDVWNELIQPWTRRIKGPIRIGKLRGSHRDRGAESSTFTFYDICRCILRPYFASRGEGKRYKKEGTRTLSQTIPPFPHKYSYRNVSSLAISLTYRCVLSVWYMCREKSYEMLITEIKTGDARSQNPPAMVFHFILWKYGVRASSVETWTFHLRIFHSWIYSENKS